MANLRRKDNSPVNTTAPTITGSGEVGRCLFLNPGTWTAPDYWFRYEYSWLRNDVVIEGEDRPTLWCTGFNAGDIIACDLTAISWTGQSTTVRATKTLTAAVTMSAVSATDEGFKALQTTGSITSGSNSLTVASATGFTVGDYIIVEIGTEAGLGARLTVGVGGTWPTLTYANAAARTADTSQANNTFAADLDTGKVYRFVSGAWTRYGDDQQYYTAYMMPKALLTTITNISGNTLTLATNASATATNANVYFDNRPAWSRATQGSVSFPDPTPFLNAHVTFPEGTFAFSDWLSLPGTLQTVLEGAGKTLTHFKSPRGCYPFQLYVSGAGPDANSYIHLKNIHFLSNFKDEGWHLGVGPELVGLVGATQQPTFSTGVFFQATGKVTVESCKFTNPAIRAIACQSTNDIYCYDTDVISEEGHLGYLQWLFQFAGGVRSAMIDCTVTSSHMLGGFESFSHRNIQMVRCVGINACFAINGGGPFVIDSCSNTTTANSQKTDGTDPLLPVQFWNRLSEGFISINTNATGAYAAAGGWVRNCNYTQEAYFDANNDILRAITIASGYVRADGNPSVLITGGYPLNPSAGGLIAHPGYTLTALGADNGGAGVISDGKFHIRGVRFTGALAPTPGFFRSPISMSGNGRIENCVVDATVATSATITGNLTNAEFEAL